MSKYIDRAALFNSLSGAKTVEEIFAAIQAAPAADVREIRRGHWMEADDDGVMHKCSVCGEWSCCCSSYCGECGAAMIEEEEA